MLAGSWPKCAILATSRASPMVAEEERRERHLYLIGRSEFMCFLISDLERLQLDLVMNTFSANLLFYIS